MLLKPPRFRVSRKPDKAVKDEAALLEASRPSRDPRTTTLQSINSNTWSWEVVGIVFSLGCSIALIILLQQYDSHTIPQWHYGITLNAVISVLATAAKGSFLLSVAEALSQHKWLWFRRSEQELLDFETFDKASRGPWGSLNLLLRINFRDVASFGALITVLSLAFDPFMQQVIAYKPRSVHSGNTTLGRTQFYNDPTIGDVVDGVSLKLRSAFYSAIFDGDQVQAFTPSCPTGNCTWPPLTSLAFCSTCENIIPKTAMSCKTDSNDGEYNNYVASMQCNYTISNALPGFEAPYQSLDGGEDSFFLLSVTSLTASVGDDLGDPQPLGIEIIGQHNPWAGFARATLGNTEATALDITNLTVCALMPCLKTYTVSVVDGAIQSTEADTWRFQGWTSNYTTPVGELLYLPDPPENVVKGNKNMTFTIGKYSAEGLMSILATAFNGSVTLPAEGGLIFTSDIMQAIYLSNDLGHLMDNVAASISSHMRNVSSEPVLGKVWTSETYVHVRWVWLILPMALAPASLLFLLTAIWASRKDSVGIWKSSGLATLFHGLESASYLNDLHRQSDMDDAAKTITVRLSPTDHGTQKLVSSTSHASPDLPTATANCKGETSDTSTEDTTQIPAAKPQSLQIPRKPVASTPPLAASTIRLPTSRTAPSFDI